MLVFLSILVIPLIYIDSSIAMANVWMVNETFTHGFLIFPLSLWLIWQKRSILNSLKPVPEPRVFSLLIVAILCWVIAAAVDVQIVQQFSMVSIIIISIWILLGWQVLKTILFPLMFLFFAVPFGQSFIPPLMSLTADFTVRLVQISGIPIFQDGLNFSLPSGSWSVVEECSGVRYLIASFSLGSIYAYLNYSSPYKRFIFITLSLIVPIIGNILRAYGIVMIGHYSGMTLATGVDHLLYGWVFFGVLIFMMFFFGRFWWDSADSFNRLSDIDNTTSTNKYTPYAGLFLLATIALTLSSSIFVSYLKPEPEDPISSLSIDLPQNFAGWQFYNDRKLDWEPILTNPDAVVSRGYVFGDDLVQINIAYYSTQRQGAEAISSNNRIVSQVGGEWKIIRSTVIQENAMYFSETQIRKAGTDILVWHWYKMGELVTPDQYIAKAMDAYNLIVEGRTDAAMITLATRINGDIEESRQNLRDFWLEAGSPLDQVFKQLADKD